MARVWAIRVLAVIGALTLLVASASIPFVWVARAFSGCAEGVTHQEVSPDGHYAAQYISRGCGGAIGSVQRLIRIKQLDQPEVEGVLVMESPGRDIVATMTWQDARTLVLHYRIRPGYRQYVSFRPPPDDVHLILRYDDRLVRMPPGSPADPQDTGRAAAVSRTGAP